MTGKRGSWNKTLLAIGVLAMLLPSAVILLAEEKAAEKPATTAPAKTKEQKEAEEVARVMDFFHRTQPDVYKQAHRLQETDPEKFKSLIQPAIRIVNMLEDLKKRDPEYYDLKMKEYQLAFQSRRLAEQLHRNDLTPADREKIMAELADIVSQEFDNAQQVRRKEIANIVARVKRLQADLSEREKNKDKHLNRRLNDLTDQKNP